MQYLTSADADEWRHLIRRYAQERCESIGALVDAGLKQCERSDAARKRRELLYHYMESDVKVSLKVALPYYKRLRARCLRSLVSDGLRRDVERFGSKVYERGRATVRISGGTAPGAPRRVYALASRIVALAKEFGFDVSIRRN